MTDPAETPASSAQEAPGAHASRNGTVPPSEPSSHELTLVLRAIEDLDMRVQSLQVACALITGLALLLLVLEVKGLRG